MIITYATPGNLCLDGRKDEVDDEPLGCSEVDGGVGERGGTLSHEFGLGGIQVEDYLLGLMCSIDWLN